MRCLPCGCPRLASPPALHTLRPLPSPPSPPLPVWLWLSYHARHAHVGTSAEGPERGAAAELYSFGQQLQGALRGLVLTRVWLPTPFERVLRLAFAQVGAVRQLLAFPGQAAPGRDTPRRRHTRHAAAPARLLAPTAPPRPRGAALLRSAPGSRRRLN